MLVFIYNHIKIQIPYHIFSYYVKIFISNTGYDKNNKKRIKFLYLLLRQRKPANDFLIKG